MQLVCIEAAYGFVTIATQRTEVLNKEAMGYGSVLYTLKSNTAIKSLSDFKGKKIGVGSIVTVGSFLLSWKVRPSASARAGCLPDGFPPLLPPLPDDFPPRSSSKPTASTSSQTRPRRAPCPQDHERIRTREAIENLQLIFGNSGCELATDGVRFHVVANWATRCRNKLRGGAHRRARNS